METTREEIRRDGFEVEEIRGRQVRRYEAEAQGIRGVLNINEGVALFPMQLLFAKFFIVAMVVIGFIVDVPDPGVMQRPPRAPGSKIATDPQAIRWAISVLIIAAAALALLSWGPDEPSTTDPSVPDDNGNAVVAMSVVNMGLVMRRERQAPWSSPVFPFLGWILLGSALTWAAVELNMLQRLLETVPLTGAQRALVLGLSLISPLVVAVDNAVQIRHLDRPTSPDGLRAVVDKTGA